MKYQLGANLKQDIEKVTREGLEAPIISMEQGLHLIQILAQYKAENMRLRHTCKDLEKQVSLVMSQYEEHCSAEKS